MQNTLVPHSFHIPVMGLGYTVDTPIKVARFGISSVVSIMDDQLLEDMRKIHSKNFGIPFNPIEENEEDYRARRITAYLNFLQEIIDQQIQALREEEKPENIKQYLELLPQENSLSTLFSEWETAEAKDKLILMEKIRNGIVAGSVDVNIMTKVDKINRNQKGEELPREFSDALSALRGFANSRLNGSVVFSAGMNPALFSYAEQFKDFFPDESGIIRKGIILKVSDYRSALIQGKFMAKKGLWISEFRIESGLNCGGHAFATDGFLAGPILEEFKINRQSLFQTLKETWQQALLEKGISSPETPTTKISYQGGIGTAREDAFLRKYYELDGTGWGSPFLLVPEATSVDRDTIDRIIKAKNSDFYLSHASPLGVPFNNLRNSSGEEQRIQRIQKNRPGSPCYKKFLTFSTEFTEKPICTASRQYQNLKMKSFEKGEISPTELNETLEKDCLCEGLGAPAILANGEIPRRNLSAVTICPGPNLAYFKGVFSLKEMVDHIYGKVNLKLELDRPHVFIKEAELYLNYLKKEFQKLLPESSPKQSSYLEKFRKNLDQGLKYYQDLVATVQLDSEEILEKMKKQLSDLLNETERLQAPHTQEYTLSEQ
ncbi:hypothetical protein [Algoriphagus sp. CAU 1675]|uniref:hypothetical protein n=1 Tax=Algoriphagus sp. CAU 1675 TaxID=3032597 RepID=UPI0023DBA460|nr:hypothetical protein [Algoriphagus sp. CAU 1675]MDF2158262.1 hypothetical protein [Algoriphagus sp. CAU 1675]